MTASGFNETRTYNANLQLTELVSGAGVHLKYNYAASQNNGQIVSQQDLVSGETISYQYDSLKRLVQASAAGDPSGSWSQNFDFDGFGNLTNKTSTNAPQLNVAVDWATNRIQSFSSYDANGNMTGYAGDGYSYDLQNRMIQATVSGVGTVLYGYDTTNHRIYKGGYNSGTYSAEEFYFYGVEGHKYGTWQINPSSGVLLQASVTKQWFGGRLVSPEDRLGSKGRYFAFGEERTNITPPNPSNDQEKFATYTRDAATGLDYAKQRYFSAVIGRFTAPDPFGGSQRADTPQSWNRYSYVEGDSANAFDPEGLYLGSPGYAPDPAPQGPADLPINPVPGDGGGGGGDGTPVGSTPPSAAQQFDAIFPVLQKAAKDIAGKSDFKEKCLADFAALQLTADQVRAAAASVRINFGNAAGGIKVRDLYQNAKSEAVRNSASSVFGETSVAQYLSSSDGQTQRVAVAALGGNDVYINSLTLTPVPQTYYQNAAVTFHEILHNASGLTDPDIQRAFGLPDNVPSDNITQKLKSDCY